MKAILLLAGVMLMTACGGSDGTLDSMSKDELKSLVYAQMDELDSAYTRLEEVEAILGTFDDGDVPSASISRMQDGTNRLTFNSFRDKIMFSRPLEYPGSTQISSTGSVNITNSLSLSPTGNWAFQLKGTELEIEHSSGITGVIKAGAIRNLYDREMMQQDILETFIGDMAVGAVSYSKLFLNDHWWGMQAMMPVMVDSEDAFLRVGVVGLGEQCFVYSFIYDGKQEANKDETILTLLKTVNLFGQTLRVEQ